MPRVLILSASVGAGHTRAAQAVELAIKSLAPAAETRHADMMDLTNAVFRRVYREGYFDLIRVSPHVAGLLYDLTDRRRPTEPARGLKRLVQKANFRAFYDLIAEPWDLIINTHFLPADLISQLRKRGKLRVPSISVVTDFDAHAFWATEPTDRYFVAGADAQLALEHWGVPPEKIAATGIPIHPVFSEPKTVQACRAKHALAPDRPCILILSGGCGIGPVENVVRAVLAVEKPLQLVVLAGKNEKLKAQLQKIRPPAHHALKLLGFTTEIDELLRAADLVVSKPGGLTTSEVLATGAAMAIINPIPGQESRNSDMLLEAGAAVKLNSAAQATEKLSRLLAEPARLAALRSNAKALGRPRATFDVAEAALAMVRGEKLKRRNAETLK